MQLRGRVRRRRRRPRLLLVAVALILRRAGRVAPVSDDLCRREVLHRGLLVNLRLGSLGLLPIRCLHRVNRLRRRSVSVWVAVRQLLRCWLLMRNIRRLVSPDRQSRRRSSRRRSVGTRLVESTSLHRQRASTPARRTHESPVPSWRSRSRMTWRPTGDRTRTTAWRREVHRREGAADGPRSGKVVNVHRRCGVGSRRRRQGKGLVGSGRERRGLSNSDRQGNDQVRTAVPAVST